MTNEDRAKQVLLELSAPDLLDALKDALDFLAHGTPIYPGSELHQRIVDAVAKAHGVQAVRK